MSTTIQLKRSNTPNSVPSTTDLASGELAVNTNDGVIYFKKTVDGTDSIVALQQYSAGTGVSINSGAISIGQDVSTTANVSFATGVFTDTGTGPNYTVKIENATGSVFGIGTGSEEFGIANDALNNEQTGYVPYTLTGATVNIKTPQDGNPTQPWTWSFNSDGTTSFPNYTFPATSGLPGQILTATNTGVQWQYAGGGGTPTPVKTFNILGNFSGFLAGTAKFIPLAADAIKTIVLVNAYAVSQDLVLALYRNNTFVSYFTLPAGRYTYKYNSLNILINTNESYTVNVVSGYGNSLSMSLYNIIL